LAKTVDWLNQYDNQYQVAMLYVSDHGESLGEKGVYLHGMPNSIAPTEQKHVAAMMWSGKQSGIQAVAGNSELTHDAITPSLLKLFDVTTQATQNKALFIR
jgi:lipid A ethanolaminephosphotransferase